MISPCKLLQTFCHSLVYSEILFSQVHLLCRLRFRGSPQSIQILVVPPVTRLSIWPTSTLVFSPSFGLALPGTSGDTPAAEKGTHVTPRVIPGPVCHLPDWVLSIPCDRQILMWLHPFPVFAHHPFQSSSFYSVLQILTLPHDRHFRHSSSI